jgi:hypothetical protein
MQSAYKPTYQPLHAPSDGVALVRFHAATDQAAHLGSHASIVRKQEIAHSPWTPEDSPQPLVDRLSHGHRV